MLPSTCPSPGACKPVPSVVTTEAWVPWLSCDPRPAAPPPFNDGAKEQQQQQQQQQLHHHHHHRLRSVRKCMAVESSQEPLGHGRHRHQHQPQPPPSALRETDPQPRLPPRNPPRRPPRRPPARPLGHTPGPRVHESTTAAMTACRDCSLRPAQAPPRSLAPRLHGTPGSCRGRPLLVQSRVCKSTKVHVRATGESSQPVGTWSEQVIRIEPEACHGLRRGNTPGCR